MLRDEERERERERRVERRRWKRIRRDEDDGSGGNDAVPNDGGGGLNVVGRGGEHRPRTQRSEHWPWSGGCSGVRGCAVHNGGGEEA